MEQALEKLKEETRPIVHKEDQENQEGNKRRKIGERKTKWTQKKREKGEIKLILNKRRIETRNFQKNWKKKKKS